MTVETQLQKPDDLYSREHTRTLICKYTNTMYLLFCLFFLVFLQKKNRKQRRKHVFFLNIDFAGNIKSADG